MPFTTTLPRGVILGKRCRARQSFQSSHAIGRINVARRRVIARLARYTVRSLACRLPMSYRFGMEGHRATAASWWRHSDTRNYTLTTSRHRSPPIGLSKTRGECQWRFYRRILRSRLHGQFTHWLNQNTLLKKVSMINYKLYI